MKIQYINHTRRLLFLILIAGLPLIVAAQTNDRVLLNVTVTTEKGDAIVDLTRENFSVNIDKRPQNIFSFEGEGPASIGILIDKSGSLHEYEPKVLHQLKQNLKAGLERFVQLGHPDNEYFVMTFDKHAELLQDWTSEVALLTKGLDSLEFKGQTALYDTIVQAVPKVMGGRHARHVLIVVSDGHDSYSRSEEKHVREALKRSDVVMYAVGIVQPGDSSPLMRQYVRPTSELLNDFTAHSGGRALFSIHFSKSDAFTQAFESFALELRNQYRLGIEAEQSAGKEKWHKLNVTVARNDASGRPQKLIVRTRKGYYH